MKPNGIQNARSLEQIFESMNSIKELICFHTYLVVLIEDDIFPLIDGDV